MNVLLADGKSEPASSEKQPSNPPPVNPALLSGVTLRSCRVRIEPPAASCSLTKPSGPVYATRAHTSSVTA